MGKTQVLHLLTFGILGGRNWRRQLKTQIQQRHYLRQVYMTKSVSRWAQKCCEMIQRANLHSTLCVENVSEYCTNERRRCVSKNIWSKGRNQQTCRLPRFCRNTFYCSTIDTMPCINITVCVVILF